VAKFGRSNVSRFFLIGSFIYSLFMFETFFVLNTQNRQLLFTSSLFLSIAIYAAFLASARCFIYLFFKFSSEPKQSQILKVLSYGLCILGSYFGLVSQILLFNGMMNHVVLLKNTGILLLALGIIPLLKLFFSLNESCQMEMGQGWKALNGVLTIGAVAIISLIFLTWSVPMIPILSITLVIITVEMMLLFGLIRQLKLHIQQACNTQIESKKL
jgi:hypothetical protein